MLAEFNEAQDFLIKKFGSVEAIKPGTYAIPTKTSKGSAFMKVEIHTDMRMSDFGLYWDENLSNSWYDNPSPTRADFNKNKLLLRIIVLPIILALVFITAVFQSIHTAYLFLRWGGEWITYKKGTRTSINDIFEQLTKENP